MKIKLNKYINIVRPAPPREAGGPRRSEGPLPILYYTNGRGTEPLLKKESIYIY